MKTQGWFICFIVKSLNFSIANLEVLIHFLLASVFCPKPKIFSIFFWRPCPQALLINHQWGGIGFCFSIFTTFETLKVENGSDFRFCSLAWFFVFQKWPLSPMSPISDNTLEYHRLFHHCTGFAQSSASQSQNAIYFSIIAMPKKLILLFSRCKTFCKPRENTYELHLYCWDHVYKVNEWCLVDCFHRECGVSTQVILRHCIAKYKKFSAYCIL